MPRDAVSNCQCSVSEWIRYKPFIQHIHGFTSIGSSPFFPWISSYAYTHAQKINLESVLLFNQLNCPHSSNKSLMNTHPLTQTRLTILLITDVSTHLSETIDQIQRKGYLITIVKTKLDAMELMQTTHYAAIVLDLSREKTNRASLLCSFTQIDPLLPIIVLQPDLDSKERMEFIKHGAFEVLHNPLEEQELNNTLERITAVDTLRNLSQHATHSLMIRAERHQSIMETARDGIILADLGGNIISWNKAAEQMFEYSATEVIGKPLTLLVPSRYRKSHPHGFQNDQALVHGQAATKPAELHGLKKGGTEFPIELSLSRSPGTTEQCFCAIIHDISARKQTEKELLERSRLLSLDADIGHALSHDQPLPRLLQGCTEALVRHLNARVARIWTLNTTTQVLELQASAGLYTHVNGSHARIPVGQLKIGKIAETKQPHLSNSIIGDPSIPDQEWAHREGLVSFAGYPLMRNHQVVGVMGMFSKHPLTSFTLNSLGIVGHRITLAIERDMAQKAHQNLARQHEHILASAEEGIYGVDRNCQVTFINPAGASILGYAAEELIGHSVHAAIHHSFINVSETANAMCPMCMIVKTGNRHHCDTEFLWRKDHSCFPAEFTSTPIWEGDHLTGAVITFQDITERKRMAEQLLEEAKLAGVTRALGDITHDMKNMLMPVLSGATLIEEELRDHFASLTNVNSPQSEATKNFATEALSVIIKNTRRLHDRVREIADTVKGVISSPCFAPCMISEIVKNVFDSLHLHASEKDITLHSSDLNSLPLVLADENRLFNAFYNLVDNAIPETPPGGRITIAGEAPVDSPTVTLSITDTGDGMPANVRDSLFTEKTISRKVGGTGLGTKIVKDIIDDHGGTITVNSEPGLGTTFTITLPVTLGTCLQTTD